MKALRIYAGPAALERIQQEGLRPKDIGLIPGAAGGPKGLILGPLDRFIFGQWLTQSSQRASGGRFDWRMAHGQRLLARSRGGLRASGD